jgi:hypothetical protein
MPLKQNKNGQYVISSKRDAVQALALMEELREEIEALSTKYGLTEMMQDAAELKKAATGYMTNNNVKELDVPKAGKVARLQQAVSGMWIGDRDDIPDDVPARDVKTLKSLVSKSIWLKLTRRVPDSEKIAEAVQDGLVTEDEISDAYFEKPSAPYLRLYDA